MIYNLSGFPCSDELYHHGVPDQKWGVRRYQYPDGTLTPLGKIHYGVKKTGEAIGKAAGATGKTISNASKKVAKYEVDKFKRNHPWTMSDEELNSQLARAKKIKELSDARETVRGRSFVGKMSNLIWDMTDKTVDNLAQNAATDIGKGIAKKLLMSEDEREKKALQDKIDLMNTRKNYREKKLQNVKDYDDLEKRTKKYYEERAAEYEKEEKKREKERAEKKKSASKPSPSKYVVDNSWKQYDTRYSKG